MIDWPKCAYDGGFRQHSQSGSWPEINEILLVSTSSRSTIASHFGACRLFPYLKSPEGDPIVYGVLAFTCYDKSMGATGTSQAAVKPYLVLRLSMQEEAIGVERD
jgi:hypothetical protein